MPSPQFKAVNGRTTARQAVKGERAGFSSGSLPIAWRRLAFDQDGQPVPEKSRSWLQNIGVEHPGTGEKMGVACRPVARCDRMGERARCDLETVNLDDLRHNLDSNQQRFGEIGGFRRQSRDRT